MDHATNKLADPEFRHERARKAAKARTSTDYYIDKLVRSAPPLTPEQVERIRALLPPPAGG